MTRPPEGPATPTSRGDRAGGGLPLSVWPAAQQTAPAQRAGRYLPESTAHPAKMLPAIARHAIAAYTQPGELVVDPMCGIGTTLVEAAHLGRDAIGVEYEPRWAELARANSPTPPARAPRAVGGSCRATPGGSPACWTRACWGGWRWC
jgi:modification methylase